MAGDPLVTGGTGFAGSHLIAELVQLADRSAVSAWSHTARWPPSDGRVRWRAVDLLDRAAVDAAIVEARPSVIYHCAGAADVHGSWQHSARGLQVNALGTHYLVEAAGRVGAGCSILLVSSALVYASSDEAMSESQPVAPSSPYAVSKLAQELVAGRAAVPVIVARPFNHAGPRQKASYVTSSFARQIAEIEAGRREPTLRVGNLDARRDITDVRDTVAAYRMLAERGRPGRVYNVCSGRAYRVGDLLEMLLARARAPIRVERDPSRLRPSDIPVVLGDPARIQAETGWRAAIPIERTLADLLAHWRGVMAADPPP